MKSLLSTLVFILFCYSIEFITDEIIKKVEQKYGLFAEKRFKSLQRLILELQSASDIKKLEEVNNFFNDISYSSDKDTYGVTDYWATPFEFLAHGEGDCEDYAIAKYFLLKHLGITSNKMFITYVNVLGYDQAHMVLTYFDNPNTDPYILDNFKTELLQASQRTDLKPIYYFNPEILKDGVKTSAHKKWDQFDTHGQEDMVIKSIQAGAVGYILKPITDEKLAQVIGEVFIEYATEIDEDELDLTEYDL